MYLHHDMRLDFGYCYTMIWLKCCLFLDLKAASKCIFLIFLTYQNVIAYVVCNSQPYNIEAILRVGFLLLLLLFCPSDFGNIGQSW